MSRRGDLSALQTAFFRKDDLPEFCRLMDRAFCRDNVCAQVTGRNVPCTRKDCGVHPPLNAEWLAEAQKLAASLDDGKLSVQVKEIKLASGMPPPCLAYGRAACYVEKRMLTKEEIRTGIPQRPQRAATRTPMRCARAPTRAPWADLSDELSEAPPSTATLPPSDTDERSTGPPSTASPSDADERSLPTSSAKTAQTKTAELKQARSTIGDEQAALCEKTDITEDQDREVTAEMTMTRASKEEMREEVKAQEKMQKEWEAALTQALAQAHANVERLEKMLDKKTSVFDSKKEELKGETTQTVEGGQDALRDVLRDMLRILSATSTPSESRISFVLENYAHHLS